MSRRRNNNGSIRGPASALTSFLANLGVEPPSRLSTWSDTSALNADTAPPIDPAVVVTDRNVEAGPSRVGEGTPPASRPRSEPSPSLPPRKRARATSVDSDDLDAHEKEKDNEVKDTVPPEPLRGVGEFMICGECANRFTVTAYTKEHPRQPSTWLCVSCCYALGINPFEKPKKAKKTQPAKKEERGKVVHYETRKGAAALGELCIKMIGSYIEDVDQLGDIGSINMDKVCRIISKSRKLTHETASLFYSQDRTELAMYDCTNLGPQSYIALANLCPNLVSLRLDLCGQISTDAITAWGKSLPKLRRLELFAPFLVRKEGWISLFNDLPLESFLITQSPRIDLETIEHMVTSCPDLEHLRLCEVGQLSDVLLQPLARLHGLVSLDISSPGSPLSDEAVGTLLQSLSKLETLNLSATGLTDETLPSIAKYCPSLRHLFLRDLEDLDNEAVAAFFRALKELGRPGLVTIDLEKAQDLRDEALSSLIDHSGPTIERLSIHGWKDVGPKALQDLTQCKTLRELDVGWCRNVTDFVIKDILESCEDIEIVRVWGCNQLTDAVPRKRGVRVIGIETHAI